MKGAGYGQAVKGSAAVGIEERHGRRPASGAEQGIKILRRHRIGREGIREGSGLEERLPRFEFPEKPFLGRILVVLIVEMDEVETPLLSVKRLYSRYYPPAVRTVANIPGRGTCMLCFAFK